jgi:hypothetical protein
MALVRGPRRLAVAVAAAVWSAALPAHACDCRRLPEPSAAIATEAAFIFAGRVLEIRERREHLTIERDGSAETSVRTLERTVVFEVSQVWRGTAGRRFTLATDWSDCGYPFRPGVAYVVFADATGAAWPSTSLCMRTTPLDQAQPLLRLLGPPR